MQFQAVGTNRNDLFVLPFSKWRRSVLGTLFCRECETVLRSHYPTPIDVTLLQLPDDTISSFVSEPFIGVIHVELIEMLRVHLADFAFGSCYDQRGALINEFRTIYSDAFVYYHDTSHGDYRRCSHCGTRRLAHPGDGEEYILASDVRGRKVVQDRAGQILIAQVLASRIDRRVFPHLSLTPVTVRDELVHEPSIEEGWLPPRSAR